MDRKGLDDRAELLGQQISQSLGTGGRGFEGRAAKAGRAVPKHVRRQLDVIADARTLKGHPKLERQIDESRVDAAITSASSWLETVDAPGRRRRAALDMLAEIAFRLLVVAGLVLAVLIWRGFV